MNKDRFYKDYDKFHDEFEGFEDFIKNLDINIAELEKIGALFIAFGYANFFHGAELDILESLEENFSLNSPDEITLLGQKFVLIGYIILFVVAIKRYNEKKLELSKNDESTNLTPYKYLVESYFLSVLCNYIRYLSFYNILNDSSKN